MAEGTGITSILGGLELEERCTQRKKVRRYRVQSLLLLWTEVTTHAEETSNIWCAPTLCKNSIKKPTEHSSIILRACPLADGFTPMHSCLSVDPFLDHSNTTMATKVMCKKRNTMACFNYGEYNQCTNVLHSQNKGVTLKRDTEYSVRCSVIQTSTICCSLMIPFKNSKNFKNESADLEQRLSRLLSEKILLIWSTAMKYRC